ncbi:hypothetical protein [Limnobacter parvus]|uniref:Uncharacterized protein n=1 Tax=Limnobacter parvus TaxID=2939690 RepID=A0ABT1XFW8_9BURK|nr:hypothetical protein [Limnobacter parvus]MCR2746182.1 hypothetical protein [Limnobacter parvus]
MAFPQATAPADRATSNPAFRPPAVTGGSRSDGAAAAVAYLASLSKTASAAGASATAQASIALENLGDCHVLEILQHFNSVASTEQKDRILTPFIRQLSEDVAGKGSFSTDFLLGFVTKFVQTKPVSTKTAPTPATGTTTSAAAATGAAAVPAATASPPSTAPAATGPDVASPSTSGIATPPSVDSSETPGFIGRATGWFLGKGFEVAGQIFRAAFPFQNQETESTAQPATDHPTSVPPTSPAGLRADINSAVGGNPKLKKALAEMLEKLKEREKLKAARETKKAEADARAEAIKNEGATKLGGITACTTYEALLEKLDQNEFKTSFEEFTKKTSEKKTEFCRQIETADRANRLASRHLDERLNLNKTGEAAAKADWIKSEEGEIAGKTLVANFRKSQLDKQVSKSFGEIQNKLTDWVDLERPEKVARNESFADQLGEFKLKLKGFLDTKTAEKDELKTNLENAKADDPGSARSQQLQTNLVACNQRIGEIEAKLTSVNQLIAANKTARTEMAVIAGLHSEVKQTERDVQNLPFSLPFMANGKDPALRDNVLMRGLKGAFWVGNVNANNHAMGRASWLRTTLAGFGSHFTRFNNSETTNKRDLSGAGRGGSRTELAVLGGMLKDPSSGAADRMIEFFTTGENVEAGDRRRYIHDLAAGNLVAAGFNTKTLKLDAPSLQYKVDRGFSALKKAFYIGKPGVTARDPIKHIQSRLNVLANISEVFQEALFRNGKPVNIQHAIQTPNQAIEACSLLLAALPNDLLVNKSQEVSRFLKQVREFEDLAEANPIKDDLIALNELNTFKSTIKNFHEQSANWLNARDKTAETKSESIAASKDTGAIIVSRLRKGTFRKAASSTVATLNTYGVGFVREGAKNVAQFASNVSRKESMKALLKNSPNTIGHLRHINAALASAKENSPVFERNSTAIKKFLAGEKFELELEGPISEKMALVLVRVGNLMEEVWSEKYPKKARPGSIKLQAVDIAQICRVQENAAVLKFLDKAASASPVEAKRESSIKKLTIDTNAKAAARLPDDSSTPVLGTPVSKRSSGATSTFPSPDADDAKAKADEAKVKADAAARATALQAEIEQGIEITKNESVEAWVTDLWTRFFEPQLPETPDGQRGDLVTSYAVFLNPGDPKGANLTPAQKVDFQTFKDEIKAIADAYNADPRDLTGVSAYMNKHVAFLLHARRGIVMRQAQVYAYERPLQNVSGSSNRCWARAGWGAAVHALEKSEFLNRTMAAIQWLSDNGKLPDNSFKVGDDNKVRDLYQSIVDEPEQNSANELYATEKRLLMMALAEHSTQYPLSKSGEGTLKTLKSDLKLDDNKKENPQAEAEFPTALLNALGLPVIINTGSPEEAPDLFFPANFNVNSARHPKNWPILYNTGGVSAGHWQFHMPRSNRPPATTTS